MTLSAVQLVQVQPIALVAVRRQAKQSELSNVLPDAFGVLWKFIRERQLKVGRNVGVYRDGVINLEVGVELEGPFDTEGDVIRSATPGGTCVTVTHFGPYQELGAAYRALSDWCAANGKKTSGPSWEIYGHWLEEWNTDPSKVRTDVFIQVA